MSYTHIHLPELDTLKAILESNPEKAKYYQKYGAWMGSTESVEYLNKILMNEKLCINLNKRLIKYDFKKM